LELPGATSLRGRNAAGQRRTLRPMEWPASEHDLVAAQLALASGGAPWQPPADLTSLGVAGVFVCFGRGGTGPGAAGDLGWAAGAVVMGGRLVAAAAVVGEAGFRYVPGLLALREGQLLEKAMVALPARPDVLLVNATGRDHPRRAGLALHLGAVLDVPTVGVTHRTLLATGSFPETDEQGATAPLRLDGEVIGRWVCTRSGRRPLAIHAGWRTDPESAVALVLAVVGRVRTPEPLRQARRLARSARAAGTGSEEGAGSGT